MKLFKLLFLLIMMAIMAGCSLGSYSDNGGSTAPVDNTTVDVTELISVNAPSSVSRSIAVNIPISSVDITIGREDGSEIFARKTGISYREGTLLSTVRPPVKTWVTVDVTGYDSMGSVNSYGSKTLEITTGDINLDITSDIIMNLYPYQIDMEYIPMVSFTGVNRPAAVPQNDFVAVTVSGSVSHWPEDRVTGETVPAVDLYFSADVNGTTYNLASTTLNYTDRDPADGVVKFADFPLQIPGDAAPEAGITIWAELTPGGKIAAPPFAVPQMSAVTGLTAIPDPIGKKIDLAWTNPEAVWFEGVEVRYTSDTSSGVLYSASGTGFSHMDLDNGKEYTYTVLPYITYTNGEGNEAVYYGPASSASAAPVDRTAPDAPGFSASIDNSTGIVSLSWSTPAAPDFSAIMVYRDSTTLPMSGNSAWDTLLLNGTYSYRIEAYDLSGNYCTVYRNLTYTDSTAPNVPTGLTASVNSSGTVSLSWTNPGNGDFSYVSVYRNSTWIKNTSGTSHTESLPAGGTYTYTIYAYDLNGNRSASYISGSVTWTIAKSAVYLRSIGGNPWGRTDNETALDRVFGSGNWETAYFETVNLSNYLIPGTVIVIDGSDSGAIELNTFLSDHNNSNLTALQNWVYGGGKLFLNSAPNEGGNINFGFGGVTMYYPNYVGAVGAVNTGHSIFNGPYATSTSFTGSSFAHGYVSGGGITSLLTGDGLTVLAEKTWGSGRVIFGSMTMPGFHSPQTEAQNLRANIFDYLTR